MPKIEAIPATLSLLRRVRGMTQKELAERSGLREEQVSRYLNGKVDNPGTRQFFRLLDALEVDLGVFHFVHKAVQEVFEVTRPRRPTDPRVLNRRLWDKLLEALTLLDVDKRGGQDAAPEERSAVEQVSRLLMRLESTDRSVSAIRQALMRLLAELAKKMADEED